MRGKRGAVRLKLSAWFVLAALVGAGCGRERAVETPPPVAEVGEAVITAEDFAMSYEFGFQHLKRGDEPRVAYLERMIDEKLLALEGYRQGLADDPEVRRQVESLREELLVEQVFEREVNDRVTVSDDEVRAAMQRERVQFSLRYLPAATQREAHQIAQEVRTAGFDAALDRVLQDDPERRWQRADFESPYLGAHDLDPALLEAIADLPVGAVSEPVPYRGSFLTIQVADVRREPMPPVTDPEERERYEHVLFLQKAKQEARRFIGEMMGPLDVRIKPHPFRTLRDGLWALYEDEPATGHLFAYVQDAEGPDAETVRALFPEVLMTTRDGDWTVEAFLRAFPADRYPLSDVSLQAFESDLYDALGLTLRDRAFVEKAETEGLGETPDVEAELARWTDRWVYRALLRQMADTVQVSDAEARLYFDRHADHYRREGGADATFEEVEDAVRRDVQQAKRAEALPEYLAALRQRYPVTIHHAVLDTLSVVDPSGAAASDVLFFKGHTGRLAYPVVDPTW